MKPEILFTHQPIVIPPLALESREVGALIEFLGIVRELENGTPLAGLHYEAYEKMARLELQRLLTELAEKFPVQAVLFIHRLGWVPVGEASLLIRIQSAHRGAALSFCAESIDRLKLDVPIWKSTTG
jgi:molybdopterin synthase catalytic subunit